jgi:AhpD family alkylhydroperoxidase
MTQRIAFQDMTKGLMEGLIKAGIPLRSSTVDIKLMELVKYRVSQINSCAFCLDMHYKDALEAGEDPQRLYSISAWKECPYYSEAERAALAFTDAAANANLQDVDDEIFAGLSTYFSKTEIADLAVNVALTGAWNRINKTFRTAAGHYKPGQY